MITFLLLLILVWHFYIGYTRGLLLQGFYFAGSIAALVIAGQFYKELAQVITLWIPYSNPSEGAEVAFFTDVDLFDLSYVYYAGIAFLLIFMGVYLLVRLLGIFLHLAPLDYFDNRRANCISGTLSVLVTLLFFSQILSILATVPLDFVQNALSGSFLVRLLVSHFPALSALIENLWTVNIPK
ncbi:CvpA family protein [Streptococcus pantholopis]|uniref:Colicin V production protein n=1 Tax=Streptococcus pantholopis TaxID=1811193 RepID=A0A172Q5A6_9STRE|nr:CvpA family protein [Streptococcus pantholopis]AND78640.1 colicin V production protein [Streptococcus pantholopis]